ncbi:hypothetical protein D9M68_938580 [compost metagenome]
MARATISKYSSFEVLLVTAMESRSGRAGVVGRARDRRAIASSIRLSAAASAWPAETPLRT